MAAQEYVGTYRLINAIRSGKTCTVFDALNDARSERVALKVLDLDAPNVKEEASLLKHEYQVAGGFDHPHVIKVYQFGKDRNCYFLVMELFQTPNLKQLIQQGTEELAPIAVDVIRRAAQGLAYMHSHGWVHRDVKPDNFLVNLEGDVKLIDFALAVRKKTGLARLFAGKTKVQGTRSYMSPEQIRGQPLDERADVYSFGCMVYEILGGKPPYTGTSNNDLLSRHLKAAIPPLQSVNRNVTDQFANLVKATLAKKPQDRPASMNDFLSEMQMSPVFKVPPAKRKQPS